MSTLTEQKSSSYFREVQNELKKVNWTSKEELIFCTKTVIIATFVFGLAVYAVDLSIKGTLEMASALVRRVFG